MRFLLTRPIEDSERVARLLRQKHANVHVDPLMLVKPLTPMAEDILQYQALIFTSANSIRAFSTNNKMFIKPVFVVGDNTRKVALQNGFENVISADGDVKKLSDTIISSLNPHDGPLLYQSGKHSAGTLCEDIEKAGFSVKHQLSYHVVAAQTLSDETKDLLKNASIDYIPFYSPRSALIFKGLIEGADLQDTLTTVSALCLSLAVKNEISSLTWKEIMTADNPNQRDMFKLIDIDL